MDNGDPQTYSVIGAAMEVHRALGCGFLESVYQEALAIEFAERQIPFHREVKIPIRYKAATLKTYFQADFVCYQNIVIETKAIKTLGSIEEAQIINYLKATGSPTGLLINFGNRSLQHRRFKN